MVPGRVGERKAKCVTLVLISYSAVSHHYERSTSADRDETVVSKHSIGESSSPFSLLSQPSSFLGEAQPAFQPQRKHREPNSQQEICQIMQVSFCIQVQN